MLMFKLGKYLHNSCVGIEFFTENRLSTKLIYLKNFMFAIPTERSMGQQKRSIPNTVTL